LFLRFYSLHDRDGLVLPIGVGFVEMNALALRVLLEKLQTRRDLRFLSREAGGTVLKCLLLLPFLAGLPLRVPLLAQSFDVSIASLQLLAISDIWLVRPGLDLRAVDAHRVQVNQPRLRAQEHCLAEQLQDRLVVSLSENAENRMVDAHPAGEVQQIGPYGEFRWTLRIEMPP